MSPCLAGSNGRTVAPLSLSGAHSWERGSDVADVTVKDTAGVEFTGLEVAAAAPAAEGEVLGMGWLPDLPDVRDFTPESEEIKPLLEQVGVAEPAKDAPLPKTVDLRQYFSPIDNQGNIGSCTAHAGTGLLEYYERRAHNNYIDASRLFLYKATRELLGFKGDSGAFLRGTMG